MKTIEIKDRLHHYIETAQESKLKAIYSMVENEITEQYNQWDDANFIAELAKREEAYLTNQTKKFTIDETVTNALNAIKK